MAVQEGLRAMARQAQITGSRFAQIAVNILILAIRQGSSTPLLELLAPPQMLGNLAEQPLARENVQCALTSQHSGEEYWELVAVDSGVNVATATGLSPGRPSIEVDARSKCVRNDNCLWPNEINRPIENVQLIGSKWIHRKRPHGFQYLQRQRRLVRFSDSEQVKVVPGISSNTG
jgi:hypothetical protein